MFPEGWFFAHALYGLAWVETGLRQPAEERRRGAARGPLGAGPAGIAGRPRPVQPRPDPGVRRLPRRLDELAARRGARPATGGTGATRPRCAGSPRPRPPWPPRSTPRPRRTWPPTRGRRGRSTRRWRWPRCGCTTPAAAAVRPDHPTLAGRGAPAARPAYRPAAAPGRPGHRRAGRGGPGHLAERHPAVPAGDRPGLRPRAVPAVPHRFVVSPLGLGPAVREYPRGLDGPGDVDSGPLPLGVSFSATVVTLGAAQVQGDRRAGRRAGQLRRAGRLSAGHPAHPAVRLRPAPDRGRLPGLVEDRPPVGLRAARPATGDGGPVVAAPLVRCCWSWLAWLPWLRCGVGPASVTTAGRSGCRARGRRCACAVGLRVRAVGAAGRGRRLP